MELGPLPPRRCNLVGQRLLGLQGFEGCSSCVYLTRSSTFEGGQDHVVPGAAHAEPHGRGHRVFKKTSGFDLTGCRESGIVALRSIRQDSMPVRFPSTPLGCVGEARAAQMTCERERAWLGVWLELSRFIEPIRPCYRLHISEFHRLHRRLSKGQWARRPKKRPWEPRKSQTQRADLAAGFSSVLVFDVEIVW